MADGPGLRDSVYVAGCKHHCPGCHNPESWNMLGGTDMSIEDILKEINSEFTNITISGGDPFYQPGEFLKLLKGIHETYPNKSIWVYTGYTIEELTALANTDSTIFNILLNINVIVEGRFVLRLRDTSLLYRGSSNQRIFANCGIEMITLSKNIIKWKNITNNPNEF